MPPAVVLVQERRNAENRGESVGISAYRRCCELSHARPAGPHETVIGWLHRNTWPDRLLTPTGGGMGVRPWQRPTQARPSPSSTGVAYLYLRHARESMAQESQGAMSQAYVRTLVSDSWWSKRPDFRDPRSPAAPTRT